MRAASRFPRNFRSAEHSSVFRHSGYHRATSSLEDATIALSAGITIALLAGVGAAAVLAYRSWRRTATERDAPPAGSAAEVPPTGSEGDGGTYSNEATDGVFSECFKLAFNVTRFDYQILGEHAAVLERVQQNAAESVHQREYFPRRPMLLPKLLQALNDDETSRSSLVQLILKDPSLAGSVLQRANSSFYRVSPQPIDSLDAAVQMLGTEGLRGLMATAILQPVFRLPKGYFDQFAGITWEQAQRCAGAAEAYAKSTRTADPFIAQLLGLFASLARIVLFRLTMDMYREMPNVLPRAEVFIRAMQTHGASVAKLVASTWELSDPSIAALAEQADEVPPAQMSPLGRAVYFGELSAALALLVVRKTYSLDGAQALLVGQGLPRAPMHTVWRAATAVRWER
jgi:HD-like signal output (HDOD) protein